jgi:hypothetical protein
MNGIRIAFASLLPRSLSPSAVTISSVGNTEPVTIHVSLAHDGRALRISGQSVTVIEGEFLRNEQNAIVVAAPAVLSADLRQGEVSIQADPTPARVTAEVRTQGGQRVFCFAPRVVVRLDGDNVGVLGLPLTGA